MKATTLLRSGRRHMYRAAALITGQGESLPDGLERYGVKGRQVFFGYYDLPPTNADASAVLALSAEGSNRPPSPGSSCKVGYFRRGQYSDFTEFDVTEAWCRQQGCRLQWYPRLQGSLDGDVIYNIVRDLRFESVVRNVYTGKIQTRLPVPVYDVSRDGQFALTLDFGRLGILRPGYGYATKETKISNPKPATTGVDELEVASGRVRRLFSIEEVADLQPDETMAQAIHYFNHISISPKGTRFIVFHFWHRQGRKYSRIICFDRSTGVMAVPLVTRKASHYSWIDNDSILCFCAVGEGPARYHTIRLDTGSAVPIEDPSLRRDGHPTVLDAGMSILTDTYPDRYGYQDLLIHDSSACRTRRIARMYSPLRYSGEMRCDLHPRVSQDKNWICVDSARDGMSAIYLFPNAKGPAQLPC